jgi:hypothetical protein
LWNTKLFGYFVFGSNKPVHQNQMQLQWSSDQIVGIADRFCINLQTPVPTNRRPRPIRRVWPNKIWLEPAAHHSKPQPSSTSVSIYFHFHTKTWNISGCAPPHHKLPAFIYIYKSLLWLEEEFLAYKSLNTVTFFMLYTCTTTWTILFIRDPSYYKDYSNNLCSYSSEPYTFIYAAGSTKKDGSESGTKDIWILKPAYFLAPCSSKGSNLVSWKLLMVGCL